MQKENIKTIFVNPVERISVQGRHKQVYVINSSQGVVPTVSMRKSKEIGTTSTLQFLPNPNTGKLETGLNVLINNYILKGQDPDAILTEYNLSESWREIIPKLVKQDKIKKQTWFEIKHGVEPDFYTDDYSFSMTNLPTDLSEWGKKTYLQAFKFILYPRPNRISNESPRQELAFELMKVSPNVALNKNAVNSAYHDWYISEENEAELEKSRKTEIIENATYELVKLKREAGKYKSYQVAILLRTYDSLQILKGSASVEKVNNVLSAYIKTENNQQFGNIERFNEIIEMTKSVEGLVRFNVQYLVQQAINTNVIAKRDNTFVWHSKAGTPDVYDLGSSFEKIINFFVKEYNTFNWRS